MLRRNAPSRLRAGLCRTTVKRCGTVYAPTITERLHNAEAVSVASRAVRSLLIASVDRLPVNIWIC